MREGYIGAANIQLVPNTEPGHPAQPLVDGDEIEFVPARGVAELIDEFKTQLTPVINDVRRVLADMNRPDSDFRKSMEGARVVMQQLPETNRELRKVLRDTDRTVVAVGGQAQQQFPLLAGKLATTLDELTRTSAELREATRKNSEALHEVLTEVPGLIRDSGDLVREGQDVMGAARNSWLLRDGIEPRTVKTLPVDSFESGNGIDRPEATHP